MAYRDRDHTSSTIGTLCLSFGLATSFSGLVHAPCDALDDLVGEDADHEEEGDHEEEDEGDLAV